MRTDSPNAKAMDNKLLLSLIVPGLSNRTLAALSRAALWSIVSELVSSDYYWYRRTQHLSTREIAYRPGDWKVAYYLLEGVLSESDPFPREVAISPLAVSILIEMGCDPTDSYMLIYAADMGQVEVMRLLLEDGRADPIAIDSSALRFAAEEGQTEIARLLLEDGRSDPTAVENYALRLASENGQTEVVRLLLEDGRADPTAKNGCALRLASREGHPEVIRLLLEDGRVSTHTGEGR